MMGHYKRVTGLGIETDGGRLNHGRRHTKVSSFVLLPTSWSVGFATKKPGLPGEGVGATWVLRDQCTLSRGVQSSATGPPGRVADRGINWNLWSSLDGS